MRSQAISAAENAFSGDHSCMAVPIVPENPWTSPTSANNKAKKSNLISIRDSNIAGNYTPNIMSRI